MSRIVSDACRPPGSSAPAPETFELDDDDYLQILDDQVTPDNESRIRQAVASCPRNALSIVED